MKHCGNEACRGRDCESWEKCRGETIPPWKTEHSTSTAAVCIREQDVTAAAEELANAALDSIACEDKGNPTRCFDVNGNPYCQHYRLCKAIADYRIAKGGIRP